MAKFLKASVSPINCGIYLISKCDRLTVSSYHCLLFALFLSDLFNLNSKVRPSLNDLFNLNSKVRQSSKTN